MPTLNINEFPHVFEINKNNIILKGLHHVWRMNIPVQVPTFMEKL